jgi:hypothetical protein
MSLRNYWLEPGNKKLFFLVVISLILSIAYVNPLVIAQPGLDPSWQIALTKAHSEGLNWGEDIVFTYGPLGYLFFGSFLGKKFLEIELSRYLLSFIWAFLSLKLATQSKDIFLKLIILLSFIFIPILTNETEIKFTLIIQALIIGNSDLTRKTALGKYKHVRSYLLGILSIFLLLVKFNFGLLAVASCLMITLSELIRRWLSRSEQKESSYSINGLLSGYLGGLAVFFSPLIRYPYFALALGCIPAIFAIWILNKRVLDKQIQRLKQSKFTPFLSIGLLLLVASLVVIHPQINQFIFGSLEITKGYSQSMAWIGNSNELAVGLFLLAGIIALGASVAIFDLRLIGSVFSILIFSFMSFKHGFVRHDAHVLIFAFTAPSYLVGLRVLLDDQCSPLKARLFGLFWMFFVVLSLFFPFAMGMEGTIFNKHYDFNPVRSLLNLNPSSLIQKVVTLSHPQAAQQELFNQKYASLERSLIKSPSLLAALQDKTVDIQPLEVSLIEANYLDWHPAPIFQSYSAYTRWLDYKNLMSYKKSPPDRILYTFGSIDDRHPFFEQPQTTLFTLCNYKQQPGIEPIAQRVTGEVAALEKRETPLCVPDEMKPLGQPISSEWKQKIALAPFRRLIAGKGHILIAKIDVKYSLFGKFYNTLYRTPPIYLSVRYKTGQVTEYRLVPDTAKSGLVVGNLPDSLRDALTDFNGYDDSNPVRSISVMTSNSNVFREKIAVSFWDLKKKVESPVDFNPSKYLELYPDVKAAGVDPKQHYMEFGFFEGRRYQ